MRTYTLGVRTHAEGLNHCDRPERLQDGETNMWLKLPDQVKAGEGTLPSSFPISPQQFFYYWQNNTVDVILHLTATPISDHDANSSQRMPLPPLPPTHPSVSPSHLFFFFSFLFFNRLEGKMNDRYSFTHVPLKNCRNYGCILSFSSFSSFISLLFLIFLSSFVFYFDAQDIVSKYGGGHAHLDAKLIAGAPIPKHKE